MLEQAISDSFREDCPNLPPKVRIPKAKGSRSDTPVVIAFNVIMARPVMNTGTKYRAPVCKTHSLCKKNHSPHN